VVYAVHILQDCELQYMADKPCGLQRAGASSWTAFSQRVSTMVDCKTGYEPGLVGYVAVTITVTCCVKFVDSAVLIIFISFQLTSVCLSRCASGRVV